MDKKQEDDIREIHLVRERWTEAVNVGDAPGCRSLLAEGATHLPPGNFVLMAERLEETWGASYHKDCYYRFSFTADDVKVEGDQAVETGTFTAVRALTPESPIERMEGQYISVLKREEDGAWKFEKSLWQYGIEPAVK